MRQTIRYYLTTALLIIAISAGAYDVTITPPSNGTMAIGSTTLNTSTTVTLTVTPDDGYYITANDITITPTGNGSMAQTRTPDVSTSFHPSASSITAEGKGTYTFTMPEANARIDATFTPRTKVTGAKVNLSETSFVYNGSVQQPTISSVKSSDETITFASGESTNGYADYDASIPNSSTATTSPYTVTVTFRGMYTGEALTDYTIKPQPLNEETINSTISLSSTSLDYKNEAQAPKVTIEGMTEGTDFSVKYKNSDKDATSDKPKEAGTYTIVIVGIGNYSGEIVTSKTFTIAEEPQQEKDDQSDPAKDDDTSQQGNDDQPDPAKEEDKPQQEIIDVDQSEPVIVDGEPLYELTEEIKESLKLTFDADIYLPSEANTRTTITEDGGLSFTKGSDVKMVIKNLVVNSTLKLNFDGKLFGDSHYITLKNAIGSSTRSEGDLEIISGAEYDVIATGDMVVILKLGETAATISSVNVTSPSYTGIRSVESDSTSNWFDLQGYKRSIRPTTKGVYILNGKKIVIK